MRYLLVVGFVCKMYRREPQARIHVNDQLIDEFHISHTPENGIISENKFHKIHPLHPFSREELHNIRIKNFPALKFYEVEIDEKVKHVSLRINIINNDNNYSNGFMTHSTLVKLKVCYFFPFNKRLLLRLKKIRDKYLFGKSYAWYTIAKNLIFDLVNNGISWKGSNGQFGNIQGWLLSHTNIGGNGDYISQLIKKNGIFRPTITCSCRYSFDWDITSFLFDKYRQYENQRNTN